MIFDPRTGALYANDGAFIKTVNCPISLRVKDLAFLPGSSFDRRCHTCNKTIRCIDELSDAEVQRAMDEDYELCVFATGAAQNVVFLKPIGEPLDIDERLPVIKTARNLETMADAYERGLRVVLKRTGTQSEAGCKYIVYQHNVSGELWWSGDYRDMQPREGDPRDWTLVADWFYHQPDKPFPLAAYLVPRGLKRGQRVLLEDVIEYVGINCSGQGDTLRLLSCVGVWDGDEFELDEPEPVELLG